MLPAIENEIKHLTPPPSHAAWIQAIPREIDEPLILELRHESLYLTDCASQLRTGLNEIEMEWRNILDTYSIQRLVRFVMSSSERAERLRRRSNPFFAI